MFDFIRANQLDIMLVLCVCCTLIAFLLLITRFLPPKRKWILINLQLIAVLLLGFDRAAYIYSGDTSDVGYVMVRLSNFVVFFMTSNIMLGFNLYLIDLITNEGKVDVIPTRMKLVNVGAVIGMIMVIISQFTGLYYTFDDNNVYQRGPGFLVCYFFPVILPIMQYSVIHKYRKVFSRLVFTSLVLYIVVPVMVGIIQIFTYGLSIVNMSLVIVTISLYIFAYLDINDEVERAHGIEIANLQKERSSMKNLFEQTASAIVTAVEKKDDFSQGHSMRVADYAKKIARESGKSEEECDDVYHAALLHDVGMIGIPDDLLSKDTGLSEEEYEIIKKRPVISGEILSSIREYPFLAEAARYSYEKYDGTGYPDGLKGEEIPEISRIISVAGAYDSMSSRKRFREPLPYQIVREEFIKGAGAQFDPVFSEIMVNIIDSENKETEYDITETESEIECGSYRDRISSGIPVVSEITRITFRSVPIKNDEKSFYAPSMILFDSYDKRVHDNEKSIKAYSYIEYGEIWFNGHNISTNARNIKTIKNESINESEAGLNNNSDVGESYEIIAARLGDHMKITTKCATHKVETIIALPDKSKSSYIALTGENCRIFDIIVAKTDEKVKEADIPRIVETISFTNRMESDLPNIQSDGHRTAMTRGVDVKNGTRLEFHTMSLPSANLVWNCPFIILFYSDDKTIGGEGYLEYAVIKLNGEVSGNDAVANNNSVIKRDDGFPGWDVWKTANKKGMECRVDFIVEKNKIILFTENFGISIENTTTILDGTDVCYVALTGDQVAITDIRIS